MARAPSVLITEKDISGYSSVTKSSGLTVGLVGYATFGPVDKAVLVESTADFVSTFGTMPSVARAQIAAYNVFAAGGKVVYKRIVDANAKRAEKVITPYTGVEIPADGETPASNVRADASHFLLYAQQVGTMGNTIKVVKSSAEPVSGTTVHTIKIYLGSKLMETIDDVSMTIAATNFFGTKINKDPIDGGSRLIKFGTYDAAVGATSVLAFADGEYTLGTSVTNYTIVQSGSLAISAYDYQAGADGIPSSGSASLFSAALSSTGDLSDLDALDFSIVATPDNQEEAVQAAAIALCEARKDAVYLVDPPLALTAAQVKEWHNGTGGHGRTTALNTSYAALYWGWQKTTNPQSGEMLWCPPSVFMAPKFVEMDKNYGIWSSPAGDTRGRVSVIESEASATSAQREALYGAYSAVNPIVNFAVRGTIAYGDKTLLRANSALAKLGPRLVLNSIKKQVKNELEKMIFEAHLPETWERARARVAAILDYIQSRKGIAAYTLTLDGTINGANEVNDGLMRGTLSVTPVNSIQAIDFDISMTQAGVTVA